ncbi:MAG TPA: hypothetical protein VGF86_02080 [Candidatus Tumulicola sp.]|jgi:hypothetical protein
MSERLVEIALKIPDNAAFTALLALRRLGLDVARVERSEVWRFDDRGDPATLADRVRANETIFNPNKHRLVELETMRPRPGETWIERRDDGDEVRAHLGGKGIAGVNASRRYAGWRLLTSGGEPASRETLAAAVAGLLCNPAIEKAIY